MCNEAYDSNGRKKNAERKRQGHVQLALPRSREGRVAAVAQVCTRVLSGAAMYLLRQVD